MGSLASLISGLTTIFEDLTGKTAATKANEIATEIWDEITTGSKLSDADGDTYIEVEESVDDDYARIYTAGSERIAIDNSGNVGIGTSNPLYQIDSRNGSGGSGVEDVFAAIHDQPNISGDGAGILFGGELSGNNWPMGRIAGVNHPGGGTLGGALVFYTKNDSGDYNIAEVTEKMRIDYDGNVGIGTASPGYQLELSTDSAGKPSTNTWTIVSDERVKKNIEPFNDGLEVLLSLEPIKFEYNGKGGYNIEGQQIGFNATEEIKKNKAPYLFGIYKAKLNEDDKEETELLNYNGHALPFILLNSIKELKEIIDKQQKVIHNFEKRIEKLEKKNNI